MKAFALSLLTACFATMSLQSAASVPTKAPVNGYPDFAIGADVSWTQYIEDSAYPTYYRSTLIDEQNLTNVPLMMAAAGMDAVRLRVWVDPKGALVCDGFKAKINGSTWQSSPTYGYCGVDDMVEMAARFARQGLRLMVSFQMSDTWADPGRQYIPAAWSDCTTIDQLRGRVVNHVTTTLQALKEANVRLEWVQIGNETSTGMLKYQLPAASGDAVTEVSFGCGISSSNMSTTRNFVTTFEAAAKAAKAIYPDCKTVLHIAEGNNWAKVNWTLANLKKQGFSSEMCDLVGLSLYPCNNSSESTLFNYTAKWQTDADRCLETMNNIYANYGYRTILSEIGMNNEWSLSTPSSVGSTQAGNIEQCDKDVRYFTKYLIDNLATRPSTCDGLFYWEPETDYLLDYTKGACVSATPGSSWPRDKVRPNAFWEVCREASSFPDGGLTDYVINGKQEIVAEPLYVAGDFNEWDYANATPMTYNAERGVYECEIEASAGKVMAISFGANDAFKTSQIAPAATINNGVTSIFVNTDKNFALPYEALWQVTVNTTLRTICFYTTQQPSAAPTEAVPYKLYYWTGQDNFVDLETEDGKVYHLTGFSASQWFNFQIALTDWTFSAGGVQVNYDSAAKLNVNSGNAWTSMAVAATDHWWYNAETNEVLINSSAVNPWIGEPQKPEGERFIARYNNSSTRWDVVYAYVLDADCHQLAGAWPGIRLTPSPTEPDIWTMELTTNVGTPAKISFSNGLEFRDMFAYSAEEYFYEASGVDSIEIDVDNNSEVIFYNLQGIRVDNPSAGFYIRRQGAASTKVIIR